MLIVDISCIVSFSFEHCFVVCGRRNSAPKFPLDPEIERTLRTLRTEIRMAEESRALNETHHNRGNETEEIALHEGEEASSSSNEQHPPEFGTRMREMAQHLSP